MEKKLPTKILVIRDKEEGFLSAEENIDDINPEHAGQEVGVYRLTHTRRLSVKRTLSKKDKE